VCSSDLSYLGAGWKAMPSDPSSPRLGDRVFNLLDDMNNWGLEKKTLAEVDVFQFDYTHELYAHMSVNYVRADSLPDFEHYNEILEPVTRGDFESLIADHVVRTQMLVENALSSANLKANQIDQVLLVGGSTRIPAVHKMLKRIFNKDPISPVHVDEAVSLGASIQAGMIMVDSGHLVTDAVLARMGGVRMSDVAPHSFGTIAMDFIHGAERLRNDVIIRKNTPVPTSITKIYYTAHENQQQIECKVTQGEDEDPEFVKILKTADLDLPPNLRSQSPIEITYAYDRNGMMHCKFLEPSSGRSREIPISALGVNKASGTAPDVDESEFEDLVLE